MSAKRVVSRKNMTRFGYTQIVGCPSANTYYPLCSSGAQRDIVAGATKKRSTTTRKHLSTADQGRVRKRHCPVHQPSVGSQERSSTKVESVDAYERLLGSPAYRPSNRHRHTIDSNEVYTKSDAYQRKVENSSGLRSALRHRGDQVMESASLTVE